MDVVGTWTGRHATALRRALRQTNDGFAEDLGTAVRTVAKWNADPGVVPVVELQRALDTVLDQASTDVRARFGLLLAAELPDSADRNPGPGFALRSHKFVSAYVGSRHVAKLRAGSNSSQVEGILSDHWAAAVRHESGTCTMHVWPHGAVVYHLTEEGQWTSLADFAQWRYRTYERDMEWASADLTRLTGAPVTASYVMSAYWVTNAPWASDRLDAALQIICVPRVVHGASGETRLAEERLLRDGFEHSETERFGIPDCSIAYASWAGVVYHPLDDGRALLESELVQLELALQALWVFCSSVAAQVEEGIEPDVDPAHGWRWLRAARSRLTTARSQESSPHRSMREALLSTSGLPAMLDETVTILREGSA